MTQLSAFRRVVLIVAVLNLGYFAVEFTVAVAIGSVALLADSIDFLEDAAINVLIFVAAAWPVARRTKVGAVLAFVILIPALATGWVAVMKMFDPAPPPPLPLSITALGALAVNLTCAFLLVSHRHHQGSMAKAAWLSARNDAVANVAIVAAAVATVWFATGWIDIVVGLGIALLNADAARTVWRAARAERPQRAPASASDRPSMRANRFPRGRSSMDDRRVTDQKEIEMPRAVRFDRYGDVDVLYLADVPVPEPGPGRVVVRVVATGLNPGEIAVREGVFAERWPTRFPSGQGSDFAGVIEAVGDGVTGLRAGDEVLGWSDERGAQADFVAVPADQLTAKPAAVPWDAAGALSVAGFTALSLSRAASVPAGSTVVVSGAAGGVGVLTVQLLRAEGARVIALASAPHHDLLRRLGTEPLDYHGDDLADRIRSLAPDGVDALVDTHGGGYVDLGLDLGVSAEKVVTIIDFETASKRGARVTGQSDSQSAEALALLADLVAKGALEVPIQSRYPLERIRDAYRQLAERHTAGKIVVEVAPA